jgi:FKBP-type peptidyl-prolyl cis-trans isomerase FkpA
MKSLMRISLISGAIILALTGCDEKTNTETAVSDAASDNNNNTVMTTTAQKEAYAVGSSFSTYMKHSLDSQQIKVDTDYLLKGFNDTYAGHSALTTNEIDTILKDLGERIQKEESERLEKESNESIASGDKFRAEFEAQEGVHKTESGLLYKVINAGSDNHPTIDSTVVVNYSGKLVDGREFDSSYSRNEPATFPLAFVIKGWGEGLQLIGEGGEIQLVVPPELAYGKQSIPANGENGVGIPAQSTLVFDVKLISIEKNEPQQPAQDEATDSTTPVSDTE